MAPKNPLRRKLPAEFPILIVLVIKDFIDECSFVSASDTVAPCLYIQQYIISVLLRQLSFGVNSGYMPNRAIFNKTGNNQN